MIKENIKAELGLIGDFINDNYELGKQVVDWVLGWSGTVKVGVAKLMYRQRGRFSQSFINASMGFLVLFAILFSGKAEEMISAARRGSQTSGSGYLIMAAAGTDGLAAETLVSNQIKGEVVEYRVEEGDTVSSIAQKFGISIDTIMWENDLKSVDTIKAKQILRILPITGVRYRVKRGETVHSIAKTYQVDAQNIIDYPFNSFANDETFALMAGQELIIPDGIKPKEIIIDRSRYLARTVAPIPGVRGEGNFIWPTTGRVSQRYAWYHPAVDIASRESPAVVASQGGTVVTAGWSNGGYGNYVVIDHGNGYKTLYAHLLNNSIVVTVGQRVTQGQKIGILGSTGRSTGPHTHFEIIGVGGRIDPLSVLK